MPQQGTVPTARVREGRRFARFEASGGQAAMEVLTLPRAGGELWAAKRGVLHGLATEVL